VKDVFYTAYAVIREVACMGGYKNKDSGERPAKETAI
jgi:hypothetical protein